MTTKRGKAARNKLIRGMAYRLQRDGEIEIDAGAKISEGDDNGAYVAAWVWVSFEGTSLDKDAQAGCQNCDWEGSELECKPAKNLGQRVAPGEPMPCGECPKCGALCHLGQS